MTYRSSAYCCSTAYTQTDLSSLTEASLPAPSCSARDHTASLCSDRVCTQLPRKNGKKNQRGQTRIRRRAAATAAAAKEMLTFCS